MRSEQKLQNCSNRVKWDVGGSGKLAGVTSDTEWDYLVKSSNKTKQKTPDISDNIDEKRSKGDWEIDYGLYSNVIQKSSSNFNCCVANVKLKDNNSTFIFWGKGMLFISVKTPVVVH